MEKLAREIIDGGHDDARVVDEALAWRTGIRGGAPSVGFKLARGGSVADHANGEIGRVEKMSNQPLDCMRRTSFCKEEKPFGKEMRWGKSTMYGRSRGDAGPAVKLRGMMTGPRRSQTHPRAALTKQACPQTKGCGRARLSGESRMV
eukprot:3634320-Pleurochrysis_carterae.AAC.1